MTLEEWMKYLEDKKPHYDISDEFVRNYQQSPSNKSGYIYYAWEKGMLICKGMAEPNQQWHFLESYISRMLKDEKMNLRDDAKYIYGRIKCPELLLWIAEASGISREIVERASKEAKKIIDSNAKGARNTAGCEIRKIITWNMIEEKMGNA